MIRVLFGLLAGSVVGRTAKALGLDRAAGRAADAPSGMAKALSRVLVGVGGASILGATAIGCTFPSVTYQTPDGAGLSNDGWGLDEASLGGDATVGDDEASSDDGGDTLDAVAERAAKTDSGNTDDGGRESADGVVDSRADTTGDAMVDTGGDLTVDTGSEDAAASVDAGQDGEAAAEASSVDGGGATDGTAFTDGPAAESGGDGSTCDKDGDHDLAPGPVCGGSDCDDNDGRAYSGEPDFLTFTPTPITNGDWNCNGLLEKQYKANVSCGLVNLGQCDVTSGFSGDPACGATGAFIQCQTNTAGLLCVVATTTQKTQGCK